MSDVRLNLPRYLTMNGHAHRLVGCTAGGIAAWLLSDQQTTSDRVIEGIGGAVAGILGAKLPDLIDPPTCPRHRSIGHGILPIGAGVIWSLPRLRWLQATLRTKVATLRTLLEREADPLQRALLQTTIVLCLLASGAVGGLLAGYLSHVALDATTPASLPWVC